MAVLKVKLTGHAVNWTTGDLDSVGVHDLGRISTSFSYRRKGTLIAAARPQYCGSKRKIHTMDRGL